MICLIALLADISLFFSYSTIPLTEQLCFSTQIIKIVLPVFLHAWNIYLFIYFNLFIFRQRGREGEREGEKYQCVVASHTPPTGDLACNPGMCSEWELN